MLSLRTSSRVAVVLAVAVMALVSLGSVPARATDPGGCHYLAYTNWRSCGDFGSSAWDSGTDVVTAIRDNENRWRVRAAFYSYDEYFEVQDGMGDGRAVWGEISRRGPDGGWYHVKTLKATMSTGLRYADLDIREGTRVRIKVMISSTTDGSVPQWYGEFWYGIA